MSYNTKAHKNYTNNSKNSGIGGKWDNKCPHVQDLEKSELSKLQINLFLHLVQVPKVKLGIFLRFLSSYWIYIYNIFTKNYRWQIIISYNLNSPLELLFFSH